MGRKSQVIQSKAKLSKKTLDEQAINTRAYQKSHEETNKYGAEGVEELMKHGNIKEAAVVFSYEGMGAFAKMFGNSMESAVVQVLDKHIGSITQTMEQRMEAIIEAKMLEMLEGMSEGMKKFQSEQTPEQIVSATLEKAGAILDEQVEKTNLIDWSRLSEEVKVATDEFVGTPTPDDEEPPIRKAKLKTRPRPTIADAPRPKKSEYFSDISMAGIEGLVELKHPDTYRYGSGKQDIADIAPYILGIYKKYEGIEILSSAVLATLKREYNIRMVNPTLTYRKLMALDPNLENVGFGIYKYEEKSFKPTV